ncbi:hypothetical protein CJ030_MR6G010437 [Morella rubra]|uniref:Uncharacterized protein n=1 Tax=Morella rubra TaxID=262757 RepID=A0A6A1VAU5_9ROSI|nr:hypothetical protein CJ030_MR6G010437 [Morella rubra]
MVWQKMHLGKIHANQLTIRSRLLHLICTHNLIPRGGHREEVTFIDVFVIERRLKEKNFNLPYIIQTYGSNISREQDTLTKCEQFDTTVLTRMGYRRTSRNTWVPKCQDSDEMMKDVDEAEDEPEVRRVPDPTSSFDTQFTIFKERMTAMQEAQKKFLEESLLLCKRSRGSSLRDEDFYGPLSSSMIFIA